MKARDPLKEYARLRQSLETERSRLLARLKAVNAALGSDAGNGKAVPQPEALPAVRFQNVLPLKQAMRQALGSSSMTKADLFKAVQKLGYKFTSSNPMNSFNASLYGKNSGFKNVGGKFSVV